MGRGLERGRDYRLCADMDGSGPLRMVDTLHQVYISAIEAGHAKIEGPWPSVYRASGQAETLKFMACL